jgi:hypothetical protein
MSATGKPRAPAGLQAAGRRLWREVLGRYVLEPHERRLLADACRAADELERLERALEDAPLEVPGSTGQPRAHPLLEEVRRHRASLARLIGALRLPTEEPGQLTGQQATSAAGRKMARAKWDRRRGVVS